ncbi:MAG: hypothetical protein ABII07_00595 [Patescibacteria group bacterium]|nr:hypothetical protein [Patescibacteria group bacterium]
MDAKTFIKAFQKLYRESPQISHWTRQSENCDYGDITVVSRNSYMCFWSSNLEECFYCHESRKDNHCGDCTFCEESELCYECIDSTRCYNCDFCQDCKQCTDCQHCYYCIGCENCFGCASLRRKKYHIFNKPYSKEEYFRKIAELSPEEIQGKVHEIQLKSPRVFIHQVDNENCFGDYLLHSKNCYWCFDSYLCEDSMYIFNANLERGTKDCLDCGPIANTFERCYDIAFCGYMFDCRHCYWCDYLSDCHWCSNVWSSNHCFGCVYTKNKEYLFLNEPIAKDKYEKLTTRISKELYEMGITDLYGILNYQA